MDAGGDLGSSLPAPRLGLKEPKPTLAWVRCDSPLVPSPDVVGSVPQPVWDREASKAFEALRRDGVKTTEVDPAARECVVQVCAAWQAVQAIPTLRIGARDPAREATKRSDTLRQAARLIAPLPVWLKVRHALADSLLRELGDVERGAIASVLLLFDDTRPEVGLPDRTPERTWDSAIIELERFRWRDADALLPHELRSLVAEALGKSTRRTLEPVLGSARRVTGTVPGGLDADPLLDDLRHFVRRSRRAVTLLGPSGAGKTYYAEAVHETTRPGKPFVPINCHALSPGLLDAELFGVGKDVASGTAAREGAFERAKDGTLFLDEIGDASPDLQAKLLTAIESRKALRVGGIQPFTFGDLRLIFATNVDILGRVAEGRFRHDLLYRMGRLFTVPTLKGRGEARFAAIVRSVFQHRAEGLVGETSQVAPPSETVVRRLYQEAERLFPGQIRTLGVVLEDAILEAEQRGAVELAWDDIEIAAAQWRPTKSETRIRLPPKERLARARELHRQGPADNGSWRDALGYDETAKGRKAFREWRTHNKQRIEQADGESDE